MRFQGQSALVTGAARGIGLATAKRFLDEGAEVLAVDVLPVPEARAKSQKMDLASEDGPRCVAEETRRLFARHSRQQCRRRRLALRLI